VFWKGSGSAEAATVVVPFDVDRAAVEAARHDPDAFEPLYRRYVAHIYSLAYYETRDPHVAEDVTELVFLKALAALPRFREQGEGATSTFKVWLYAIARHVIANERRTSRRRPVAVIDAAMELPAPDDPAATVVTRLEAERAWGAVMALPEERRQVLLLRLVHELSAREIGQLMGKSEGAVRVLIHRALESVRRQLAS
jgi:RNA polymerase sigma-70 factor (ECF subfamily)